MGKGTRVTVKKADPKVTPDAWKTVFLEELKKAPNVSAACDVANVSRKTAYYNRNIDQDFADAWDDAIEKALDKAEAELYRRATEGTLRPVFQGGEEVGEIREFSDTLLIFMLKSRRRATYGERLAIEIDLTNATDEQLRRIQAGEDPKRVLASAAQGGG